MSLRIGTFNVWGLPETFGHGDDVSSRMRVIAKRLSRSDLDVLLIQEAWTEEVRTTLQAGAKAAGFSVDAIPGASGGLMTLSRKPIRSARFERFHFRGDPERLAQGEFLGGKGFQSVLIETEYGLVELVNTHVHARYRRSRPRLNSAVRMAQLLQIVGHMYEHAGTCIVGGDFNCAAGDAEYEVFRGLAGVTELGGGSQHPTLSRMNYYKRNRAGQDKRIDFVFVRPGAGEDWISSNARLLFAEPARIREIDRSLSDHFGFRAELELGLARSTGIGPATPDPRDFDLARALLAIGRQEADRRERAHFETSGLWIVAAAAACGVRRVPAVNRRALVRGGLGIAAWFAIAPAIGFGTLARLDSDYKRDAFDDADQVLTRLESMTGRVTTISQL
jgi:endonuclease/exonuclease/phosphatase family metal-dependent hydrolase